MKQHAGEPVRRLLLIAGAAVAGVVAALAATAPAQAHPLGNFSVNQLEAIHLHPDRIEVTATVDAAELPTIQDEHAVDRNDDGTADATERAAYAGDACRSLARGFTARVDGTAVRWSVTPGTYVYVPGSAGLRTSRLTCRFSASADLGHPVTVDMQNHYRTDRVGWREITAAGDGVHIDDSPVPTADVSNGLRNYPKDLLTSPLDVRSATLRVRPGAGTASDNGDGAPRADTSTLNRWTASADAKLRDLVGERELTPWVGLLAVLLSLVLGAGHAALPGHGKTVMAAYLAGRRGRRRDALVVGGTVTLTHTGGVLLLGLLLTTISGLAGESVLAYLGVVSGLLVAAVGVGMLRSVRKEGHTGHHHGHGHGHGHHHDHPHDDAADHSHDDDTHDHGHSHDHDHDHSHDHGHEGSTDRDHPADRSADARTTEAQGDLLVRAPEAPPEPDHQHTHPRRANRWSLVGMGIAGGLVPSPSALVILLGAIGLGRTWFGVLLVLGYGLGMAAALTAAGLALITLQERWERRRRRLPTLTRWATRWTRVAPYATAAMVLLVGLGLAGRALITL